MIEPPAPTPAGEPGSAGNGQLVVGHRRRGGLIGRLREGAHRGRSRAGRVRGWLTSPPGRRVAGMAGRSLVIGVGAAGGVVLVRRWVAAATRATAAVAAEVTRVGASLATVARSVRSGAGGVGRFGGRLVSLRWVAGLARWLTGGLLGAGAARRYHCPNCHARVRRDAHVCYRCGSRDLDPRGAPGLAPALWRAGRWTLRLLALSLYRRCPDCRRVVHADARVCHHCGYRRG